MIRKSFFVLIILLITKGFSDAWSQNQSPPQSSQPGTYHWPTQPLGGGEKLFYDEQTFRDIRERIDKFEWANNLYKKLIDRVSIGYEAIPEEYRELYNNYYWAKEAAMYYRISGDDQYMTRIVGHIIEYYKLDKPEETLFPTDTNRSNTNYWQNSMEKGCRILLAYDLVKNHPLLKPYKTLMEKRMDEVIAEGKLYESRIRRLGNTQFWAVTVLGLYGFMRDNREVQEMAINGKHGFKGLLAKFRDDGRFWTEPKQYIFGYIDCCMLLLAEAARFNNWPEDLYTYEHPQNGASMRKLIMSLFSVCTPDGYLIGTGEQSELARFLRGKSTVVRTCFLTGHEYRDNSRIPIYYSVYKDPQLAWIMEKRPGYDFHCLQIFGNSALIYGADIDKVTVPDAKSVVYQESGDALIRSNETSAYWDGKGLSVLLRNGASQQYHSNDDHCSININAFGKNLYNHWFLVWDYLCPRKGRANNTPLSFTIFNQNTVAVDCKGPDRSNIHLLQKEQENKGLQFSEIERMGNMKRISVTGEVYEGVQQPRTICATDEYVLDLFALKSPEEHTYDYILHSWGNVKMEGVSEATANFDLNKEYGFGPIDGNAKKRGNNVWFLSDKKACMNSDVSLIDFYDRTDSLGVRAFVLPDPNTASEIMTLYTPYYVDTRTGWDGGPYQGQPERKPMGIVRRKCKSTTFVVVHQPYSFVSKNIKVSVNDNKVTVITADFTDIYDLKKGTYQRK